LLHERFPEARYHRGRRFGSFEQDDDGVTARFGGGRCVCWLGLSCKSAARDALLRTESDEDPAGLHPGLAGDERIIHRRAAHRGHGMPFRVPNTESVSRYPRTGWDRPKASDHCPVIMDLVID